MEEDWGETPDEVLHLAHSLYLEQLYACTTDAEVDSLKLEAGLALFVRFLQFPLLSLSLTTLEIPETRLHLFLDRQPLLRDPPPSRLPSFAPPSLPPLSPRPISLPPSPLNKLCRLLHLHHDPDRRLPAPILRARFPPSCVPLLLPPPARTNSRANAGPSTGPDPILESIPALWLQVDHVRTEIQRRQRALESRAEQEQVETQVLVGIKADLRLVELLMVVHGFVLGSAGKDMEMRALVEHSELRMRKCLKLIS